MIAIKNSRELRAMKEACIISARALQLAGKAIEPGVTTGEVDRSYPFLPRLWRIPGQRLHIH